jgi:hypothetical protein
MPAVNLPKISLLLLSTGHSAVALVFGPLLFALGAHGGGEFDLGGAAVSYWVVLPLAVAISCSWLSYRYTVDMAPEARSRRASFACLVWLANAGVASVLYFYFADDSDFSRVQYHGLLIGQNLLVTFAVVSILAVVGSAFAIARSVAVVPGLLLLVVLVTAVFLSEASSVWLHL